MRDQILNRPLVMLSAFINGDTLELNIPRDTKLNATLKALKLEYGHAKGYYNGHHELSFVVVLPYDYKDTLRQLIALASEFNQDSILFADSDRNCELVYHNGNVERIGALTEVPNVNGLDCYTEFNGKYWVAK